MNVNGVGGYGVGGDHHGQICQNDPKNAPNESVNVSRRRTSLSLCPWKSGIGPMRRVLDDPTYEIDLNGGGGLRSVGISRSCVSDCYWMTLSA